MKRELKESFVDDIRNKMTIIVKEQKQKSLKEKIQKELAAKPKEQKDNLDRLVNEPVQDDVYKEVDKKLNLVPLKVGSVLTLNNIFFDMNEAKLKPVSDLELSRIYKFLAENPQLEIEIGGHTNGWCSPEFAEQLSEDRAEAVFEYFQSKGIDERRITFKGYGKSDPIASNNTSAGRKQNQRVELKILDIIE